MKISNVIGTVVGVGIGIAVIKEVINEIEKERNKTLKVFISTPMTGLTNSTILEEIEKCKKDIKKLLKDKTYGKEIEFVSNYDPNATESSALECLGSAISKIGKCQYIYFNTGWEDSKGCFIEHEVAKKYNIKKLYNNN